MLEALRDYARLGYAGFRLLRTKGALVAAQTFGAPQWPLALLRLGLSPVATSSVLEKLGPAYVKLGQTLATRPDLIGAELAKDLQSLQDRMQPFATEIAQKTIEQALDRPLADLFLSLDEPLAAASIAQVHRAVRKAGAEPVAVKVLRPHIEYIFNRDLRAFARAAKMMERLSKEAQRLRFTKVVETLQRSVQMEMDMRLEAAAMSEMAEALKDDPRVRVPSIHWDLTARNVLTLEWVDGVPLNDAQALAKSGHDLKILGERVLETFLRTALFSGFFHADMHPGNLMVDGAGRLVMLDFGIVGRIGDNERRFLAEILYSFITQDYVRGARVHFEAGYVPKNQSEQDFAQALRAIGTPIHSRTAEEISMGRLMTQLFEMTSLFGMETRPELLMLQKTMVVAEGVARTLHPNLDIWSLSKPIVQKFLEQEVGLRARMSDALETLQATGESLQKLPQLMARADGVLSRLEENQRDGSERSQPFPLARWLLAGLLLLVGIAFISR